MYVCVYRAEAIAVQTVSVMIPFYPEVTIRDPDVTVLIAQSPAGRPEDELTAPPGGDRTYKAKLTAPPPTGRHLLPDEVSFQADDALNDLLLGVLGGPGGAEEASVSVLDHPDLHLLLPSPPSE